MWLADRRRSKLPAFRELTGPGRGGVGCSPRPTEVGATSKHLRVESGTPRARGRACVRSALVCRQTLAQTCIRDLATCINYPRTATREQGDPIGESREGGCREGRHGHTRGGEGLPSKQTTLEPRLPNAKGKSIIR